MIVIVLLLISRRDSQLYQNVQRLVDQVNEETDLAFLLFFGFLFFVVKFILFKLYVKLNDFLLIKHLVKFS